MRLWTSKDVSGSSSKLLCFQVNLIGDLVTWVTSAQIMCLLFPLLKFTEHNFCYLNKWLNWCYFSLRIRISQILFVHFSALQTTWDTITENKRNNMKSTFMFYYMSLVTCDIKLWVTVIRVLSLHCEVCNLLYSVSAAFTSISLKNPIISLCKQPFIMKDNPLPW